jgi:glycosyltransferase involved in cell wall biosynthesis
MTRVFQLLFGRRPPFFKKTILFIDYEVPRHDLFAGSRTIYMYLDLLVRMGFKVKFLPADFRNPEPYTRNLQKLGIDVLHGDWFGQNWQAWITQNSQEIAYVFVNKPDPALRFLDYIAANTNAPTLYLVCDLHHLRLLRKYEIEKDYETLAEANRYREIEYDIIRKSDIVLTYSHFETKLIQQNVPGKSVITVPLYFYPKVSSRKIKFRERSGLLFVGGFAHAPNLDAVRWFARSIFPKILAEVPKIRFFVVGAHAPSEVLSSNSKSIVVLGHVSDAGLAKLYAHVRLVVVPLRFGAGMKGKTIEALYHGVPVVSTRIGIEGLEGIDQLISSKDDEAGFASEVIRLYKDESLLSALSSQGRQYVRTHFGYERTRNMMAEILSSQEVFGAEP